MMLSGMEGWFTGWKFDPKSCVRVYLWLMLRTLWNIVILVPCLIIGLGIMIFIPGSDQMPLTGDDP